jgi:hypothetical protein
VVLRAKNMLALLMRSTLRAAEGCTDFEGGRIRKRPHFYALHLELYGNLFKQSAKNLQGAPPYYLARCCQSFSFSQTFSRISLSGTSSSVNLMVNGLVYIVASSMVSSTSR